ncbi:MAG: hypothetical protein KGL39_00070 [Patescibacteria group bacterium]|nr:hypothetical protein [Patescibacteria group bacterium]
MNYRPRNDYCLVRYVDIGKTPSGIATPNSSIQGKKFFIEAFGPDVEDLQVGDRILMVGTEKEDWAFLPNSRELLLIKQANIVMVYEGDDENAL